MERIILENGLEIIYVHRNSVLTSFCMGFRAGAFQDGFKLGLAHATEHMVFKGIKGLVEEDINKEMEKIFGFNNAMTNYPYAIYYGTCMKEDFKAAFNLYSEIVFNPIFPKEGFYEEIKIISQELKDWKDDPERFIEDELFYNTFPNIRLQYPIIGTHESINNITLKDIMDFHNMYYVPNNCVITIVSSLEISIVLQIIKDKLLEKPKSEHNSFIEDSHENRKQKINIRKINSIESAKVLISYDISKLSRWEIRTLKVFNEFFGEGTSSILYNAIRTKGAMAYEIYGRLKTEKGISQYVIGFNTSPNLVYDAIEKIKESINIILTSKEIIDSMDINLIIKNIKLKEEIRRERSVEVCKDLCIAKVMFGEAFDLEEEYREYFNITKDDISKVIKKVLIYPSVQVIMPN